MKHASMIVHSTDVVGPVRRRTFGSFVEHLGRCVYGGIYEPDHPTADEDGFREDVMELVRELGTSTIRYPGGNFVSGYRWEDGVGPVDQRPRRLDLAWHSLETNEIGVDEFARWCRKTGHELMMAVNLGTRGVEAALDLLEYTNHPGGTALAEARAANGTAAPHDVRMWCLGNEMDGPWQVGGSTPEEYASLAARTAAAMKRVDPDLELVACGSSSSKMPTFGRWERVVLERAYDYVDYISCHAYYEVRDDDLASFLASAVDMDYFIDTVVSTADHVKHRRKSDKDIHISFDEWNIWYLDEHEESGVITEGWPEAPHLLEDVYTAADAVVMGSLLITLLRRSDRVRSASLAQLVNVIAPIMTEPGGKAWRQTTFYPFSITSRLASGTVLRPRLDGPTYDTKEYGEVPMLDAVVTWDDEAGAASVFVVNRGMEDELTVSVELAELGMARIVESLTVTDADPYAQNTAENPDRVVPQPNASAGLSQDGNVLTVTLPAMSWTAVSLGR